MHCEQVKLCDARSGGFTHNLTGHRQAVWAAGWSPSSQWHLATGGCDGQASRLATRRPCASHDFNLLLDNCVASIIRGHAGEVYLGCSIDKLNISKTNPLGV